MVLHEVRNSYFNKRIPLENDRSILYSDYEVALVCNSLKSDWNESSITIKPIL